MVLIFHFGLALHHYFAFCQDHTCEVKEIKSYGVAVNIVVTYQQNTMKGRPLSLIETFLLIFLEANNQANSQLFLSSL